MLIILRTMIKINKFEAVGVFLCVGVMAFSLFLLRVDSNINFLSLVPEDSQMASVVTGDTENGDIALENTIRDSMNNNGTIKNMIIDDVTLGDGTEVKVGDTVSVHYIGTLQSGQQFDNSYTKGEPFEFIVGEGRVIKGWDQGLLGMKVGGQRILVIPAELAYGASAVGPIPANSTLVFSIELLEIK